MGAVTSLDAVPKSNRDCRSEPLVQQEFIHHWEHLCLRTFSAQVSEAACFISALPEKTSQPMPKCALARPPIFSISCDPRNPLKNGISCCWFPLNHRSTSLLLPFHRGKHGGGLVTTACRDKGEWLPAESRFRWDLGRNRSL